MRRAPADLVEDDEGPRAWRGGGRCAVSFISTMKVLSPRARLSLAPTRVRTRSTTPMRALAAGDEAAHLRQDDRQRDLPHERRLARHVGAGDEQELLGGRVEADVVGDEGPGGGQPLDDRVARVLRSIDAALVDLGPAIPVAVGDLGERGHVSAAATRAASASRRSASAATRARSVVKISSSRRRARSSAARTVASSSSSSFVTKRSPLATVCLRR